jgi:chitin synthase
VSGRSGSGICANDSRQWAIYKKKVYDLSDYLYTVQFYSSSSGTDLPNYSFINEGVSDLFSTQNGQDITKPLDKVFAGMSTDDVSNHMKCFEQAFYVGELDFRKEPRCTVQNYLLLTFSIILMTVIGMKCEFGNDSQSISPELNGPMSSPRRSATRLQATT